MSDIKAKPRPFPAIAQVMQPRQSYEADQAAIEAGIPSLQLMETAGKAVAEEIVHRYAPRPVLVLCGPGNNGGDGFVVARCLQQQGWNVNVACTVSTDTLKGDAAIVASQWQGQMVPFDPAQLGGYGLIVDALFGVGLARPLDGEILVMVRALNKLSVPVVSIDIPSGVDGNTGAILGKAVKANLTVTFCRKKIGHLLLPGKVNAGHVVVVPIGIPDSVLNGIIHTHAENLPEIWLRQFPFPVANQHKFSHGHVLVRGGLKHMTGATRMAATAALKAGAGLVTVACDEQTLPIYAMHFTSVMTALIDEKHTFESLVEDERKNVILIGPGNGVLQATRKAVLTALASKKICVFDADALTVFADNPAQLFDNIQSPVVLTPHEGEFMRIFPSIQGDKVTRVRAAAKQSKAVVVLKGNDTVIANPEGQVIINSNAPAWLATAGSGDVLAGTVAAMLANGVEAFLAASMAVWLHSEAGNRAGLGLIAEELPGYFPSVLKSLYSLKI